MTTAELPPRYTLVRPSLLTPESAAAAAATANAFPPPPSSLHYRANQQDVSSSYYLSPRTISALEDFEKRSRDPNVMYGRDVIQVPLKVEERDEYVNLVLSHREFDMMAVHIPQYDEMQPEDLMEEITRILKEEEKNKKIKQGLGGDPNDSAAIFQARILELEFEMKRLNTKLAAARSLQSSVTDENTTLRMNVRELEKTTVEYEKLYMQNELLREQAVIAATEVARMKKIAADAQLHVLQFATELQRLRSQVYLERESLNQTAIELMNQVTSDVRRREKILQDSYLEEKTERQLIAEKYYELSGRIRVFCRMRPPKVRDAIALLRPKPNSVLVERGAKEFSFDHVFGPESSQMDVYEQIEPLVMSFSDGYNSCIMAYGQTGTGKTFTMMGDRHVKENEGVIPRALQQVFAVVNARQLTYKDTLSVSMIEIYNDQILDLLNEDSSRSGKGAAIKNENEITARSVTLWSHVDDVLTEGNANRNIAATSMNLESSRSHALVYLHLESQHRETLETKRSTLCLVDLAGSERISRSQVEGDRLKETQHINKSLSALGDVVYALQHKAKHTPYRNSKLTYMLRDMLSGQSKTLLMLQLSPDDADVEETTCSLNFGARVSQVQMGAVRPSVESGEIFKLKDETRALEKKLKACEEKLVEWKDECRYKSEQLSDERDRSKDLERRLRYRGDEVASMQENLDHNDTLNFSTSPPPGSPNSSVLPSAPSSPTPSARSTRSTTSNASAASLPATSTSLSASRLAVRKSLSSSTARQGSFSNDTVVDKETRRKSLSTLPTRGTSTTSTLSSRTIRASREAPTSLPSRKPLTSSSVPQSPASATSRIVRPRTSLGGTSASSSPSSTASGAPRTPLRRANSLASSAGPSPSSSSSPAPRSATSSSLSSSRLSEPRRLLSSRASSSLSSSSGIRSSAAKQQ